MNGITRRWMLLGAAAAMVAATGAAQAQDTKPIRIGVLTDLSSFFAASTGRGSILGAQMAVEDFGKTLLGRPLEVVSADHTNKADVGSAIARRWFENEGVETIADMSNSAVALAVQAIGREKKKILLHTAGGALDLSGKSCSPYGFQWVWDTFGQAKVVAEFAPRRTPNTWFLIAGDYAFGINIQRDLTRFITQANGQVVGTVRHQLNLSDFASFLLQAQSSKASTIVLSSGGSDLINIIKQAAEFGLAKSGQTLTSTNLFLTDIHSLGLVHAQGLVIAESFYWDQNDKTRAFSQRFFERHKAMPTHFQVGAYSAVLHWLNAVKAVGTLDADAVAAQMRKTPVNDVFATNGIIREDGRMVHDMLVVQVKTPAESKRPWDYYKIISTVPAKDTVIPIGESECAMVKKG